MLRSLLIGLVAGQRAMTPLAVVAGAARQNTLPPGPLADLLRLPVVTGGAVALAAAEMAGDKMRTAPDRTVVAGLLARTLTAAFAGASLAPREQRMEGAALAIAAAFGSSFVGLALRKKAMARHGQVPTGFAEDAIVLLAGAAIVGLIGPRPRDGRRPALRG
ncbi:DUF4126 domain-containing protein [Aureimonas sp. ME7]|uniref:DUF4126 domain-containing protein n=1 Tax=Aureimonas sp. ME7 TaxID=2744252 RepID=UPI0015F72F08|nr:DUF4126 domain-containing protein [Aureimonas sp. ME7]